MVNNIGQTKQSSLFRDFISGNPELRKYLFYNNPGDVAARMKPPKIDRHILCDILDRQNKTFKSKPEAFRSIEKLRQDDTLVIFAGQQPGLYGGPLLTLYKAIGIVKKAILLQGQTGKTVVPIFWIACDDHDFEEVSHTYCPRHDGSIGKMEYKSASQLAVPVADISFDYETGYNDLVEQTKNLIGETNFTEELYCRLFAAYARDGNITRAFARYMTDVLPDFGLILFCPFDKEVKTLSKSFFKRLAEGHFRNKEILRETENNLRDDGYHIQAEKKDSAVHLFFHDPQRMAIHLEGDSFLVGDKRLGLPALLDLIDKYPEKFSPDVLTRPVWQSYLFPVVAQSGGPSEIAYFCQIGKLFELYGLVQPYVIFRPALTLIEKRQQDLMEKYGIEPAELTGDIEPIVNRVLSESFPAELERNLTDFRQNLKTTYDELIGLILNSYPEMEPMSRQTYGKIDSSLEHFEKKVYAQHKQNNEVTRNRIYKLASMLYPNKSPQERVINVNYFISKYGFGIIDFIIEKMNVESTDHQIIHLSEMKF